jgi:hypothetical protein
MSTVYQTSAELLAIEQVKLPLLTEDDPAFELFPHTSAETTELQWEQEDNYTGLQNVRGINGQPGKVRNIGAKRFKAEPGAYGDYLELDEKEITERRVLGTFGETMDLRLIIAKKQDFLLSRRLDRQRWMIWTLLINGTFSVLSQNGALLHTDSYPLQKANGSDWSNLATATPLADLRALKLFSRGTSNRFDASSKFYLNMTTTNWLLNNQNTNDIAGKRRDVGATFNSISDVNEILVANDLPRAVPYDETYFDDANPSQFVLFIPDHKLVVVGKRRDGNSVGDLCACRNANNPTGAPGPYTIVTDSANSSMNPVPRIIRVDDGWTGGIRLKYPSALVSLTC